MPIVKEMSLPGLRTSLLRFGGIGRETFVVVSVGGLVAATALLPSVVGGPGRQHFALPPWPVAKSAQVTAPFFAPSFPQAANSKQPVVLPLAPSPVLITQLTQPTPRKKRPVETAS